MVSPHFKVKLIKATASKRLANVRDEVTTAFDEKASEIKNNVQKALKTANETRYTILKVELTKEWGKEGRLDKDDKHC